MADILNFEFAGTERFELRSQLGSGGMGVVYEAYDRERETVVALKTLSNANPENLFRLKNEFRALQDLDHPNLVSLGELFEARGQWFFTMELVDGVDIIRYVREDASASGETTKDASYAASASTTVSGPQPYNETRLRDALTQLAHGLEALHATSRVHRDIKPSNILVTSRGRVVLLDFGLVTKTDPGVLSTGHYFPIGTAPYMAPEQAASQSVGPEADWYAVGAVLYEILTGRLPFQGSALQMMMAKQDTDPLRPRQLVPGVPADLDELCMRLLRFKPSDRPAGPQVLRLLKTKQAPGLQRPVTSTTWASLFVGRDQELEILFEAFERVQRGDPINMLVHGASGLGKSEILRIFVRNLTSQQPRAVVLSARCYERESVPFKGFDGIVDDLSRLLQRLSHDEVLRVMPRNIEELTRVFPVLGRVGLLSSERLIRRKVEDLHEIRMLAFRALRELLARLADIHPLVLIIDDLQWADEDSLKMLRTVVQQPEAPVIFLLTALRTPASDDEARQAVQRAASAFPGELQQLWIGPLPLQEASTLAEKLLGKEDGEESSADARRTRAELIGREAAGHPFFIQQLVHHALEKHDTSETLRLDDVLFARIMALDPPLRALVELVSVAGGPIQQDTAAEAIRLRPAEFSRLVGRLKVANLLRTRGMRLNDAIEPYHDRVREAVIARLSAEQRCSWHEKLAHALQTSGRTEPDLLARHFEGAGSFGLAAKYAATAAAKAAEALAFEKAASLYQKALELWPMPSDPAQRDEERRSLWVKLGDALANAGHGSEAADAYQQAVPGAKTAEALELRRRAAEQLLSSGHVDKGIELIGQVLSALGMKLPRTALGALWSLLRRRLHIRVRGVGYRERDESQVSGEALVKVDTCRSVGVGLAVADHIRGADFSTRFVLSALNTGEPGRVLRSLVLEAGYVAASGHSGSRYHRKVVSAAEPLLERSQDPIAMAYMEASKAFGAFMAGSWLQACKHAEKSLEHALRQGGAWWEFAAMRFVILWSLFYLGELRELSARAVPLFEEAMDRGDLFTASGMIMGRPNVIYLREDDPVRGRREVDRIMQRWSVKGYHLQHYHAMLANIHIDLYLGDGPRARERLNRDWPLLRRSLVLVLPSVKYEALHLRGRVALAVSRTAQPSQRGKLLSLAKRDARRLVRRRLPWTSALAPLLEAGMAAQRGQDEQAVARLETAIAALDSVLMRLYAAAARRRLGGLIGGDAGAAHLTEGNVFMQEQGIKDPARMTTMLVPGFKD